MPSSVEALRGVLRNHPLAKHTSFNIGGAADWFVETDDLAAVLGVDVPVRVIGAGTNLLVSDAGVEGLVARCVARRFEVQGTRIRAEAGLKMMRLARIAADHDLTGFEWAIGVPGAVGGAVYQNAGCWGRELRDVLVEVEALTPAGELVTLTPDQVELGYRHSALRGGALRGHLVLAATVELAPGDGAASRRRMAEMTRERESTQPIKTKNCGSVFVNPPGDSAGRLVEAAGLKGASEGAAQVSTQHANFIVNQGGARAVDVWRLIERIRAAVRERFGVDLETEVERIGRW